MLHCIEKHIALDDLSLAEFKAVSPAFEEDIYEAISMKTCVEQRNTVGAPGRQAMEKVIGRSTCLFGKVGLDKSRANRERKSVEYIQQEERRRGKMEQKLRVGILGATGMVGQRFISLFGKSSLV